MPGVFQLIMTPFPLIVYASISSTLEPYHHDTVYFFIDCIQETIR
jgi:hypothetical protein